MRDKSKNIIWYSIVVLICIAGLALLSQDKVIPGIPITKGSIALLSQELKTKLDEMQHMSSRIQDISLKIPELKESVEAISQNPILTVSKERNRVVDVPSLLAYLEQTGKESGVTVKEMDIVGQQGDYGISSRDETVNAQINSRLSGRRLVVTAEGTYESFIDYLGEIQINTREMINIQGLKVTSIDKKVNLYKIEFTISL